MKKVTFRRPGYTGSIVVVVNNEKHSYIDRSWDYKNMWTWQGRYFGYLREAKDTAKYEIENDIKI